VSVWLFAAFAPLPASAFGHYNFLVLPSFSGEMAREHRTMNSDEEAAAAATAALRRASSKQPCMQHVFRRRHHIA
jgi:hypothetical protein